MSSGLPPLPRPPSADPSEHWLPDDSDPGFSRFPRDLEEFSSSNSDFSRIEIVVDETASVVLESPRPDFNALLAPPPILPARVRRLSASRASFSSCGLPPPSEMESSHFSSVMPPPSTHLDSEPSFSAIASVLENDVEIGPAEDLKRVTKTPIEDDLIAFSQAFLDLPTSPDRPHQFNIQNTGELATRAKKIADKLKLEFLKAGNPTEKLELIRSAIERVKEYFGEDEFIFKGRVYSIRDILLQGTCGLGRYKQECPWREFGVLSAIEGKDFPKQLVDLYILSVNECLAFPTFKEGVQLCVQFGFATAEVLEQALVDGITSRFLDEINRKGFLALAQLLEWTVELPPILVDRVQSVIQEKLAEVDTKRLGTLAQSVARELYRENGNQLFTQDLSQTDLIREQADVLVESRILPASRKTLFITLVKRAVRTLIDKTDIVSTQSIRELDSLCKRVNDAAAERARGIFTASTKAREEAEFGAYNERECAGFLKEIESLRKLPNVDNDDICRARILVHEAKSKPDRRTLADIRVFLNGILSDCKRFEAREISERTLEKAAALRRDIQEFEAVEAERLAQDPPYIPKGELVQVFSDLDSYEWLHLISEGEKLARESAAVALDPNSELPVVINAAKRALRADFDVEFGVMNRLDYRLAEVIDEVEEAGHLIVKAALWARRCLPNAFYGEKSKALSTDQKRYWESVMEDRKKLDSVLFLFERARKIAGENDRSLGEKIKRFTVLKGLKSELEFAKSDLVRTLEMYRQREKMMLDDPRLYREITSLEGLTD